MDVTIKLTDLFAWALIAWALVNFIGTILDIYKWFLKRKKKRLKKAIQYEADRFTCDICGNEKCNLIYTGTNDDLKRCGECVQFNQQN